MCDQIMGDFDPSAVSVEQRMNDLENRYEALLRLFDALTDSYKAVLDQFEEMQTTNRQLCASITELLNRLPKVNP
jgi:cell shape-determining protein MreC